MKKKGIFDWITDIMAFIAGVLLVITVLIVCFEVVMRYFIHRPQVWTVEVCEYILFSIAFLGAPWLLRVGGHVNIDVLVSQFGPRKQSMLGLFSSGVGVLVSAIILWFSLKAAYDCYETGVVLTRTLTIHKDYFLLLIALGYALLLVEFARQFLMYIRRLKEGG